MSDSTPHDSDSGERATHGKIWTTRALTTLTRLMQPLLTVRDTIGRAAASRSMQTLTRPEMLSSRVLDFLHNLNLWLPITLGSRSSTARDSTGAPPLDFAYRRKRSQKRSPARRGSMLTQGDDALLELEPEPGLSEHESEDHTESYIETEREAIDEDVAQPQTYSLENNFNLSNSNNDEWEFGGALEAFGLTSVASPTANDVRPMAVTAGDLFADTPTRSFPLRAVTDMRAAPASEIQPQPISLGTAAAKNLPIEHDAMRQDDTGNTLPRAVIPRMDHRARRTRASNLSAQDSQEPLFAREHRDLSIVHSSPLSESPIRPGAAQEMKNAPHLMGEELGDTSSRTGFVESGRNENLAPANLRESPLTKSRFAQIRKDPRLFSSDESNSESEALRLVHPMVSEILTRQPMAEASALNIDAPFKFFQDMPTTPSDARTTTSPSFARPDSSITPSAIGEPNGLASPQLTFRAVPARDSETINPSEKPREHVPLQPVIANFGASLAQAIDSRQAPAETSFARTESNPIPARDANTILQSPAHVETSAHLESYAQPQAPLASVTIDAPPKKPEHETRSVRRERVSPRPLAPEPIFTPTNDLRILDTSWLTHNLFQTSELGSVAMASADQAQNIFPFDVQDEPRDATARERNAGLNAASENIYRHPPDRQPISRAPLSRPRLAHAPLAPVKELQPHIPLRQARDGASEAILQNRFLSERDDAPTSNFLRSILEPTERTNTVSQMRMTTDNFSVRDSLTGLMPEEMILQERGADLFHPMMPILQEFLAATTAPMLDAANEDETADATNVETQFTFAPLPVQEQKHAPTRTLPFDLTNSFVQPSRPHSAPSSASMSRWSSAPEMELRHNVNVSTSEPQTVIPERGRAWRGELANPFGVELDSNETEWNRTESPTRTQNEQSASPTQQMPGTSSSRGGQAAPTDVNALAQQVYTILKDRLRAERERHQLYSR